MTRHPNHPNVFIFKNNLFFHVSTESISAYFYYKVMIREPTCQRDE
jgi:hypothetical protein